MRNLTKILKNKIVFWKPTKYQALLGYRESDSKIYDIAFLHSSMAKRDKGGKELNNERLEYLGDAILEAVMSDILIRKYPAKNEGYLSSARSVLVCRKTTNEIGRKLNLIQYIQTRKTINNFNVHGNMFEALIGAIYLDKGYDKAKQFIEKAYAQTVKIEKLMRKDKNYKSLLLEWSQKTKKEFSYELIEKTRLEDNKIRFQSKVIIDGHTMGLGIGNNKRESEQAAAKQAMQTLQRHTL